MTKTRKFNFKQWLKDEVKKLHYVNFLFLTLAGDTETIEPTEDNQ